MAETIALPPSPASSSDFTDELDDEALDALLAEKGALSQWPTPPLNCKSKGVRVEVEAISIWSSSTGSDEEEVDGELRFARCSTAHADYLEELDIATVLAHESANSYPTAQPLWDDILAIESMLLRARLPMEILAMSHNMLCKLGNTLSLDSDLSELPVQLLVASTIYLASAFMDDHPLSPAWWNSQLPSRPQPAPRVDKVSRMILEALGWRLHDLCSPPAIAVSMRRFERRSPLSAPPKAEGIFERAAQPIVEEARPLALVLQTASHGDARLQNGLLTPDDTPTEAKTMFLPILPPDGFLPDMRIKAPKTSFVPLL